MKLIYMRDPYNEVFRVTAHETSEFKFNVNKNLCYTLADLFSRIDGMDDDYFPDGMDVFSKRLYWILFHTPVYRNLSNTDYVNGDPMVRMNSYARSVCGSCGMFAINVLANYYGMDDMEIINDDFDPHVFANLNGQAYFDFANNLWIYKGYYELADVWDIYQADTKLFYEPIRQIQDIDGFYAAHPDYWNEISVVVRNNTISTDNLTIRLPGTSYFEYPVKSPNIPKVSPLIQDEAITYRSNAIVTIPDGITGIVEMPFLLLEINGTGEVVVNGITYTLPDDAATLKSTLQYYNSFIRSFTINSNSGGLVADFLASHSHSRLFNKNNVELEITSGDVQYERIITDKPIDTTHISVDMGEADKWTLDYITEHRNNRSLKVPLINPTALERIYIAFAKSGSKPFPVSVTPTQITQTYTCKAGDCKIDTCFAAILTPRNDDFTTSIELTLTTVDDSACYYTLDGSDPDENSTLYSAPFTITDTTTVKWINIREGYADSHINTRTLTKTA